MVVLLFLLILILSHTKHEYNYNLNLELILHHRPFIVSLEMYNQTFTLIETVIAKARALSLLVLWIGTN